MNNKTKRDKPFDTGGYCLVCIHMQIKCNADHSKHSDTWPPDNNVNNPNYHEIDCDFNLDLKNK